MKRNAESYTKAVIYLRVSTEGQARSGLGRDAQEAACRAHCARAGLDVASVHVDDAVSARRVDILDRKGSRAALDEVRATPGAVLVFYSMSRAVRSIGSLARLVEAGIAIASATEPFDMAQPAGRLMANMLGAFAQFEADIIGERTADALAAARARGTRLGRPPMGDEFRRQARDARARGLSYRAVASDLNARGIAAPGGGRWHERTVIAACAEDRA